MAYLKKRQLIRKDLLLNNDLPFLVLYELKTSSKSLTAHHPLSSINHVISSLYLAGYLFLSPFSEPDRITVVYFYKNIDTIQNKMTPRSFRFKLFIFLTSQHTAKHTYTSYIIRVENRNI